MSADALAAVAAIRDAAPGYETAEQMFDGSTPEVFGSAYVRKRLQATSSMGRINYAQTAVTAVHDRLEVSAVSSTVPAEQECIDREWKRNKMGLKTPDILRQALIDGETYVIVWPDVDSENGVDIMHEHPSRVRVFYDPERPDVARYAAKVWLIAGGRQRVTLFYPDRVEDWVSEAKVSREQPAVRFVEFLTNSEEPDSWVEVNPYDRVPVFHFRTVWPNAKPEHFECYGAQNMLNKLIATQMDAIDFTAWPQRYALLDPESAARTLSEADAEEWAGEDGPGLPEKKTPEKPVQSGPGTIIEFFAKSVGQFQPADPAVFGKQVDQFVEAMSQVSGTPLHLYKQGGQPPSGESRRVAEMPLVKKVLNRQMTFGSTLKEMWAFVLVAAGFQPSDDLLGVSWRNPESTDDQDALDALAAKRAAGVPQWVVLSEMGYTAVQLRTWGIPEPGTPGFVPELPAAE